MSGMRRKIRFRRKLVRKILVPVVLGVAVLLAPVHPEKPFSPGLVQWLVFGAFVAAGLFLWLRERRNEPLSDKSGPDSAPDLPSPVEPLDPPESSPGAIPIAEGTLDSIPEDGHLHIAIREADGHFSGHVHAGDERFGFRLPELKLRETIQPIEGRGWTLRNIVDAILRFDAKKKNGPDERTQLDVGHYLYRQTLGRLPESVQSRLRQHHAISVKIQTEVEWIARLPWNLLADRGIYWVENGGSVSLCRTSDSREIELPPSPRLLIVAPEPPDVKKTRADEHLRELTEMLSAHDPLYAPGKNLAVVRTWEEFQKAVPEFRPELIYYYGHGVVENGNTRLVFETGPKRERVHKPVSDFAGALEEMDRPPIFAYIQCCYGDAGGFLGAGLRLGNRIPAVVANRTVVEIPVARAQAMAVWENLLFSGLSPHETVSRLYAEMDRSLISKADIRWVNPVLHAHYGAWISKAAGIAGKFPRDPHWHLKIDRVRQYNDVIAQTRLMIREQKPKSLVFVWYGDEGQGVEKFHERLAVELREELLDFEVYEARPRWPEHFTAGEAEEDFDDSFADVFAEFFRVRSLEDIPARLRAETHGRPTLLYVRHETVTVRDDCSSLIPPDTLKRFVEWWDQRMARYLEKQQYAILTVSFLTTNPPGFMNRIEDQAIDELPTSNTVFILLDGMEQIAKKDLVRFLQTHDIELPDGRKDDILSDILEDTKGHYDQTVEELKNIYRRAYRTTKKQTAEK